MKQISVALANQIGALALDFTNESDFDKYYHVVVGGVTLYRNFKYQDLLCSIMMNNKKASKDRPEGVHLNIMNNGDVFARPFPYYDGSLDLMPVFNQRKIVDLVNSFEA
jgi:hypothetical protein